jgi:hypothetical protein
MVCSSPVHDEAFNQILGAVPGDFHMPRAALPSARAASAIAAMRSLLQGAPTPPPRLSQNGVTAA